jgi:DNA-binding NtrC family response regulator
LLFWPKLGTAYFYGRIYSAANIQMSNRSVNVLVVDDDIAVCRILHRMLSDEQYEVQISQSVADALRSIEEKHFDVFVMDYKLPDGTGLDVAERIRVKGSEAPIILISGYDPSAVALRAEKLHISDIIEKPFARATICNAVKKAIGFTPGEAGSEVPGVAGPSQPNPATALGASKKKGLSKAALIGIVVLLLLIASVAIYFMTQAK